MSQLAIELMKIGPIVGNSFGSFRRPWSERRTQGHGVRVGVSVEGAVRRIKVHRHAVIADSGSHTIHALLWARALQLVVPLHVSGEGTKAN